MCLKVSKAVTSGKGVAKGAVSVGKGVAGASEDKPFDTMNNIVANLLLNLTRYEVGCGVHTKLSSM